MEAAIFDTHACVKRLVAAGMPEPQAEVIADEQRGLIDSKLATKRDIAELRRDIKAMEDRITVNVMKWTFAALLGQTAIIAALVKLL